MPTTHNGFFFVGLVLGLGCGARALEATWLSSPEHVRIRVCGMGSLPSAGPACFVTTTPQGRAPSAVAVVPIAPESEAWMRSEQSGLGRGGNVVDRDGGLFDNLPWERLPKSKRDVYAQSKIDSSGTPYGRLVSALETPIIEVMVEDAWPLEEAMILAGVVRVDEEVVDCFADEALGVALAQKCPILMPKEVWAAAATSYRLGQDGEILVEEPNVRGRETSEVVPLSEAISSPEEYLAMDIETKVRAIVAAGLDPPRPRRLSTDAIDNIVLPKVDEIVRRAVLIDRALAAGDIKRANTLAAFKSDRHRAYEEAKEASEWDDFGAEASARNRKAILDATRADPTQDPGSYNPYLDQDAWYEEERRRIMGTPGPS